MVFHTNMPFGGKQVIFVGDLFQLPPVVKEGSADAEMLHDLYGAGLPFFYKAFVLKRMNLPKIEFQKVYRQSDEDFLDILNKMRNGEVTNEDLVLLSYIKYGRIFKGLIAHEKTEVALTPNSLPLSK